MTLTTEEIKTVYLLSDRKLYPEAAKFIAERRSNLLEGAQMKGLLNNIHSFDDLIRFIRHQQQRTWSDKKAHYRDFYQGLERYLNNLPNRITGEFGLVQVEGLTKKERQQAVNKFALLLAQEFIQHLVAEHTWQEAMR